jgi:O-antigen/teichoic acid export membrane protein
MTALEQGAPLHVVLEGPPPIKLRRFTNTFAKNSAANLSRVAVTSLVSIFLPAYLTHHLPIKTYGAWVLILQVSAYVGYLDFGVQTAVSKYIAEYQAKKDPEGCGRCASVGLAITLVASTLGILLTVVLAWQVPSIFRTMPQSLYQNVRLSVVFVGVSLSVSLASSVFAAIFLGLQRYHVPMVITIISRLLFGAVICAAVASHSSLAVMGAAAGCVNIFTAFLQVAAWRKIAHTIRISLRHIDATMLKRMLKYCAVLTVWSGCMLCVSGLDLTIVGHYSFGETAYYAIAASPTSLILMIIAALMGPLLPATSALSVHRSPTQMGAILLRSTRYAASILFLTGLPFVVVGYLILSKWVGPVYALHSVQLLRVLVLANIVRSMCAPYAMMVVATCRQRVATAAAVTEGIVNLVSSICLARHLGALGVALGTLLGAVAGVTIHFAVSMRYTQSSLAISRIQLFVKGMLRPALVVIPSALLIWRWWPAAAPSISLQFYCLWGAVTLALAWFFGISREDRVFLIRLASSNMSAVGQAA